jgi:hypothetical protein
MREASVAEDFTVVVAVLEEADFTVVALAVANSVAVAFMAAVDLAEGDSVVVIAPSLQTVHAELAEADSAPVALASVGLVVAIGRQVADRARLASPDDSAAKAALAATGLVAKALAATDSAAALVLAAILRRSVDSILSWASRPIRDSLLRGATITALAIPVVPADSLPKQPASAAHRVGFIMDPTAPPSRTALRASAAR